MEEEEKKEKVVEKESKECEDDKGVEEKQGVKETGVEPSSMNVSYVEVFDATIGNTKQRKNLGE